MDQQERERIEKSIQEAKEKGLFRVVDVRNQIKLQSDAPKIVIAIPMGDKDDPDLFTCPKCSRRHFGVVRCEGCGEDHSAVRKLRHAGLVPIEWLLNAWQIVPPLLCSMTVMVRKSVLSAQARQEMTYEAIKIGAKYIFYWDDDTVIPPKALYDMHQQMEIHPECGIITGVYVTREECPEPLVYKEHGQGAYWNFSMTTGVIEPIFAAGAGCMMARVEALKDVERVLGGPWWFDEQDITALEAGEGKIIWGHDIRFCRRMWLTSEKYKDLVVGLDGEGNEIKISDPAGPTKNWQVYLAGWVQAYHFDVQSQTMYGLPKEAPCFQNTNTQSYWDRVWKSEGHDTWRTYANLYNKIVEVVPEDSTVIDVGCGIGLLMEKLLKKKHARVHGIDISEEAIRLLKERDMEGVVADIGNFELDGQFPEGVVMVSSETIEHLDTPRLENLVKQAAKCKMAVFTTPDGELPGTPAGEHVQIFTEERLQSLLSEHFAEVSVEKVARDLEGKQNFLVAVCHRR